MRLIGKFLIFIMLFTACGENKKFTSEINHDEDFLNQSEACKKVDLHIQPLNKENSIAIFRCFNWHKQLPALFQTIENFSTDDWNLVMAPLNELFFKNPQRRDEFLKIISDLKDNNGFNNLNNFVVKFFNEKDFYSFILRVTSSLNENRKEIISILTSYGIDFENIIHGLELLENITKTITDNKQSFRNSYENFKSDNINIEKLIASIDFGADFLTKNDLNDYQNILSNLILQKKEVWILNLISHGFSAQHLKKNILFVENSNLADNFKKLQKAYEDKIKCKEVSDELLIFDPKNEIDIKFDLLLNGDIDNFWQEMIDAEIKLELANDICEADLFNKFNKLHYETLNLISDDINLNFLTKIINIFNTPNTLLDFINSKYFEITGKLLFKLEQEDKFLFQNIYKILSNLNLNSLVNFDKFIRSLNLPNNKSIIDLLSRIWLSLDKNEKEFLVNLMEYQVEKNINFYQIVSYYKKLLKLDKDINKVFKRILFSNIPNSEKTLNIVNELMEKLKEDEIKSDLIKLLSEEYLIKLFKLFNSNTTSNSIDISNDRDDIGYQLNFNFVNNNSKQFACYKKLQEVGVSNQIRMIVEFPNECREVEGKFLLNLFKDISNFNTDFKNIYGIDLVSNHGFLSSKMNSDTLGFMYEINKSLKKFNIIKGSIKELVKDFKEFYFHPVVNNLKDVAFKIIYGINSRYNDFSKNISLALINIFKQAKKDNATILPLINLENNGPISTFQYDCTKLKSKLFINGCMDKEYIRTRLHNIIDLLVDQTDSDYQVYEAIIDLFRNSSGLKIPARKKNSELFVLKVSEMGLMVNNLRFNNFVEVNYRDAERNEMMHLSVLERIEAVIKDIAFLDNFYGAYFMNNVAEAKDYVKKVKALKKNLKLLESTGGMFRKLNIFPESTEYQLENILNTYDGLIEGGELGYADHLQAALAFVSSTSPEKNNDFQPYRIPTIKKVEGHKGKILTNLAELRGFSHLAELYIQANNSVEGIKSNVDIQLLDKKLFKIFTSDQIKKFINKEFIQNKELTKNNLKLFIDSILTLDNQTRSIFTSIVWDILILMHEIFDDHEADIILKEMTGINNLIKQLLEKDLFKNQNILENLARIINNLKISVSKGNNKNILKNNLIIILKDGKLLNILNNILIQNEATELMNIIDKYLETNFDILKYFKAIDDIVINSKNSFNFWENLLIHDKNDYLTKIINLAMAPNSENTCRFQLYLDNLLLKDDKNLEKFLEEIINSTEFIETH